MLDRHLALHCPHRQNAHMRNGALIISTLLSVSACTDWPDVESPLASRGADLWPELQPTETLPVPATTDDEEQLANISLQRRAAALRRRAILMRMPVTDQDEFDRLRAALAR